MSDRTPSSDDMFQAWTDAEKEVWNAWSKVEQDLSQPEARHMCSDVLDALEASAHQMTRLQALALRGAYAGLRVNPLVPAQAESWLSSWSDWQQHMISAYFGMARQVGVSLRPARGAKPGS